MQNYKTIQSNCNKLIAIAMNAEDYCKSKTLINKVYKDVKQVIERKKQQEEKQITKEIQKQDSKQEEIYPTLDGHNVKSQGEQKIDDILYNIKLIHAYSPNVPEIDLKLDQAIEADWFIPIVDQTKGVYIEYWGMNTKEYLENKKRKQEE